MIAKRAERNEQATLAWLIEALHRQKKLPRLRDVLDHGPRKRMSPDQMEAITRSWLKDASTARRHNQKVG